MKRIWLLLLLCAVTVADVFAAAGGVVSRQRPKVALVLCGGGAKGAAHVGVLRVLEQAKVPVDMIVGTSIGGLVGGLYAMGYNARQLDSILLASDWRYLLSDNLYSRTDESFETKMDESKYAIKIPFYNLVSDKKSDNEGSPISKLPSGFISGQNVLNYLNGLSIGYHEPMDFGKLPIPFACVAADLSTGEHLVLDKGILPLAMRATMAIPGVFSPVEIDGKVLVDGGIVNNFPVDVARMMGADIIIGVDIQNDSPGVENLRSIPQVISQISSLMGQEAYKRNVKDVDILIKPDVSEYGTYSFNRPAIQQLIINGHLAAMAKYNQLDSLVKALEKMEPHAGFSPAKLPKATEVTKDTFCFRNVEIRGIDYENEQWLKRLSGLTQGVVLSGSDINRGISILMGTRAFSSVTYTIMGKGTADETLVVNVTKGPSNLFALGGRYDSEEAAAMLIHLGIGEYNLLGPKFGFTGRLSMNPYGEIDYSYTSRKFPKFGISYRGGGVDMNIYKSTANQNNLSFVYQRAQVKLSNMYLRNFNFELGTRLEYFNYSNYLLNNAPDEYETFALKDEGFLSFYVDGKMDSRDDSFYATSGMTFDMEGALYQTNFTPGFRQFGAVRLLMDGAVPVIDGLVLLPSLMGRVIIGDCKQVPYLNYVGGTVRGRYFRQQLPFVGISHAIVARNSVVIGRMDLRKRIGRNHYLYAMANYLRTANNFGSLFTDDINDVWGFGLRYSYDSPVGPFSFNVHWSDYEHKVGAYVSIGHYF